MQKNETRPPSCTTHKNKFKMDQRLKCQSQNHVEKNIGSKTKADKQANKQMGLHQTKKFCTAKENNDKIKRQPTEWENTFANMPDKGLISKIYRELTNSTPNKQTT